MPEVEARYPSAAEFLQALNRAAGAGSAAGRRAGTGGSPVAQNMTVSQRRPS